MKILLVEDEVQLSEALSQLLTKNKYSVDAVYNGEDGLDYGLTDIYDVIILDIMLPKMNGIDVLKTLRSNNIATPIILLTAKGEISDRVSGLDNGADDYLVKPFASDELLARLRALCRRKSEIISDNTLKFGDLSLNINTYDLSANSEVVRLTLKEFEIIKYLIDRPNNIATKDDILTKVWGYDSEAEYNNIEVYISFLRKKLSYLKSNVKIATLRGIGYRLESSNV